MKKRLLALALVLTCLFAFAACGSSVSIDDIKTAFTDGGYTTSTPTAQAGTVGSFGATKGTTIVSVYEFGKESEADALVTVTETGASISKAKVSKKGKVFVCVAINIANEADATAAIAIFDGCF